MIFSCGEALVDLVPDPVPGGGPMNVAVAAARLGASSAFVGAVSTDRFGDLLWSHLSENGVDVSLCPRTDAPTARAIIERKPVLRFRFEGDDTADMALEAVDVSKISDPGNIVHGGTLGLFRGATADTLAALAEGHDGLVSLDPNIRPDVIGDRAAWDHFHDRWLPHVDLYKGSDEDIEWIWPDRSVESSAEWLLSTGVSAVVLTRGASGLEVYTAAGVAHAAAPTVDVVDTVGAGDTIVGALLVSISERFDGGPVDVSDLGVHDWTVFAERAAGAAAITVSRAGADVPFRSELDW